MLKQFLKENKFISTLAISSLIAMILIALPLSQIYEKWKYGAEIGKLIYDLSLGVFASYIFYFIVTFIPKYDNEQRIKQVVGNKITRLIYDSKGIYDLIFGVMPQNHIQFPASKEEVQEFCRNADPLQSPMKDVNNWHEYLVYNSRDINKKIDEILEFKFLNERIVSTLTNLKYEELLNLDKKIYSKNRNDDNQNALIFSDYFFNFGLALNDLVKCCRKDFILPKEQLSKINETVNEKSIFG